MVNDLFRSLKKFKSYKTPVSLWTVENIYQNLAYPFFLIAKRIGVTPNFVTLVSFLLFLIGATFFINEHYILSLSVWVLSYVFDCTDGALARATNSSTRFGAFLDVSVDRLCSLIFLLLIFSKLDFERIEDYIVLLGVLFIAFNSLVSTLRPLYFPELKGHAKKLDSYFYKLSRILYEMLDTGNLFVLTCLAFYFDFVLVLYSFYAVFTGFLLMYNFRLLSKVGSS
ncbi:CDP-alcohol phosphatidyltransferase family protein [Vibrio amylolyticus]|uniref:CDP-alcohol phosphatidyltransferase family protein n=1 Tax=Vibrio amylolyticus TaxID=2847292 RepID=UPI003D035994